MWPQRKRSSFSLEGWFLGKGTEKSTLSLSGHSPCVLLSWAYVPIPSLLQWKPEQMELLSHDFYLNKEAIM